MESLRAQVKSVTANVAKKTISFTMTMAMDDESLANAEALAQYVDKGPVMVVVTPWQMQFEMDKKKEGT